MQGDHTRSHMERDKGRGPMKEETQSVTQRLIFAEKYFHLVIFEFLVLETYEGTYCMLSIEGDTDLVAQGCLTVGRNLLKN